MFKKIFKKIKKENSGAVNIIMVIFLLILVFSFSLMLDLSSTMFGMNEIQSKIDMAGINALYGSVDYRYLRDEELGIVGGGSISSSGTQTNVSTGQYRDVINEAYKRELYSIDYPGTNPKVENTRVSFEYSDFGLGFNGAESSKAKSRPQVILESMVSYDVSASELSDNATVSKTKSVKSVHSNTSFEVTVRDSEVDGKKKIVIHSITRLVLK